MPEKFSKNESTPTLSVDRYLQKIAEFADHDYGRLVRKQFQDISGASELAMLACPSHEEMDQFNRAVAIMTPEEKRNAHHLTDEQIEKIAMDARIDPANFAIFINGYALTVKKHHAAGN